MPWGAHCPAPPHGPVKGAWRTRGPLLEVHSYTGLSCDNLWKSRGGTVVNGAPRVYSGEHTWHQSVILTELNLNMQARDLETIASGGASSHRTILASSHLIHAIHSTVHHCANKGRSVTSTRQPLVMSWGVLNQSGSMERPQIVCPLTLTPRNVLGGYWTNQGLWRQIVCPLTLTPSNILGGYWTSAT